MRGAKPQQSKNKTASIQRIKKNFAYLAHLLKDSTEPWYLVSAGRSQNKGGHLLIRLLG